MKKLRVSRWSLLALLAPLAVLGWLRAQENNRTTTPPTSVAVPADAAKPAEAPAPPTADDDEEDVLPPGERLSADNNLSWPVDI
jgi:hypothetical protein